MGCKTLHIKTQRHFTSKMVRNVLTDDFPIKMSYKFINLLIGKKINIFIYSFLTLFGIFDILITFLKAISQFSESIKLILNNHIVICVYVQYAITEGVSNTSQN